MNFKNDNTFLHELAVQKKKNKQKLADFVKNKFQIKLNTDAIFDVQIKRLHAYKRQLLNLLHILISIHGLNSIKNLMEQSNSLDLSPEGDGFVLLYKRLENGCFQWPKDAKAVKSITPQEFRWLLEGLSI